MTGTYEWNPMPHCLDVKCPNCTEKAKFEFCELIKISEKKDIEYFRVSSQFEYYFVQDYSGQRWHAAIFFPGLHGGFSCIQNIPEGYKIEDWEHSKYQYRSSGIDLGSIVCSHCNYRTKHELSWPEDAFYSIDIKNKILWAYNYDSVVDLKNFISSTTRKPKEYKWSSFLLHIPSGFLSMKVRDRVLKLLDRNIQREEKV